MTSDIMEPRYLSDGVYALWDGYQIWLNIAGGECIALDSETMYELMRYRDEIKTYNDDRSKDAASS